MSLRGGAGLLRLGRGGATLCEYEEFQPDSGLIFPTSSAFIRVIRMARYGCRLIDFKALSKTSLQINFFESRWLRKTLQIQNSGRIMR